MIDFTCARPKTLYLIFLLIPSIVVSVIQYRRIVKNLNFFAFKSSSSSEMGRMKHFPIMMASRSLFRSLAWIMIILAYSGISWGTYLEPVQKNGSSVSMVFDISYSMDTPDVLDGMTRLKAAEKYASMLLSHMPNSSISVVLAKGDGVTVVPLTEDRAIVDSLLDSLSPKLMSSSGTSLGKGVRAALKSFPENLSCANTIWLFTDGDETDGQLENSLIECLRKGVPVSIIGFGSERESKILAGDRKTTVYSALRSEKMKKICSSVMKKVDLSKNDNIFVNYIDATEAGSALKLLEYINKTTEMNEGTEGIVTYEVKPVQRYQLFIGLAIMFFFLGFFVTEINPEIIVANFKKISAVSAVLCVFAFSSCSNYIKNSKLILVSTGDWYQHKYNSAIAGFLQTASDASESDNEVLSQYAIYNLATTYLMQSENEAALERYNQLVNSESKEILYSSYYNTGIIAYKKGDYESAIKYFRNALKVDGTKVNAKINLEISLSKAEKNSKSKENSLSKVSESNDNSSPENAVFQRIRENEKKQWKNSETSEISSSNVDY